MASRTRCARFRVGITADKIGRVTIGLLLRNRQHKVSARAKYCANDFSPLSGRGKQNLEVALEIRDYRCSESRVRRPLD